MPQREGAPRDVLMLDIALDNYFRLCVERMDKGGMSEWAPLCCADLRCSALRCADLGVQLVRSAELP